MKNAIIYFYNIFIDVVEKINERFYFSYQNRNFVIFPYPRKIEEAPYIYALTKEMLAAGLPVYEIILTKDNNVLFMYEEKYYILMIMPNIRNRIIVYDDIINFYYIPNDRKILEKLDKSSWSTYWEQKIDYFEYQFSPLASKYPLLAESFNFYIGLWENAVSYYNDNVGISNVKQVCHKRVSATMDLLEFYNPLYFVIDCKVRDVGDYLKSYVLVENFSFSSIISFLRKNSYQRNNALLLLARVLFPSYYFDLYENIIVNGVNEIRIKEVIDRTGSILELINILFVYFSFYNIPTIDWIKKEEDYSSS